MPCGFKNTLKEQVASASSAGPVNLTAVTPALSNPQLASGPVAVPAHQVVSPPDLLVAAVGAISISFGFLLVKYQVTPLSQAYPPLALSNANVPLNAVG